MVPDRYGGRYVGLSWQPAGHGRTRRARRQKLQGSDCGTHLEAVSGLASAWVGTRREARWRWCGFGGSTLCQCAAASEAKFPTVDVHFRPAPRCFLSVCWSHSRPSTRTPPSSDATRMGTKKQRKDCCSSGVPGVQLTGVQDEACFCIAVQAFSVRLPTCLGASVRRFVARPPCAVNRRPVC